MDLTPIRIVPGLFKNRTEYSSKNRWTDGEYVRFLHRTPQLIGGWRSLTPTGVAITGKTRAMKSYQPNNQVGRYCGIGTTAGLFFFDGGDVDDITPVTFTAGREDTIAGAGYGAGPYGAEAYGTERTVSGIALEATIWTLDLWGEILVGVSAGDEIVKYDKPSGDTVAADIANAPKANSLFVTTERMLVALGADGEQGRIKWCNQEDYTDWTPTETNTAGQRDLLNAGRLYAGARFRGQYLIWSDRNVYTFYYQGQPFIYGVDVLDTNCGIVGPNAHIEMQNAAYWMGRDGFYIFDGAVRKLDCDVYDYVFDDINILQTVKFHAGLNKDFNEIWWFYCSAASTEIDRAVIYNYMNGTWTKAPLSRLAWEYAVVFPKPLAVDASGTIFEHEYGSSADGSLLAGWIECSPKEVRGGGNVMTIHSFWQDTEGASGDPRLTIKGSFGPQAPETTYGPFSWAATDQRIPINIETRQAKLKFDNAVVGSHWALGEFRVEAYPAGER